MEAQGARQVWVTVITSLTSMVCLLAVAVAVSRVATTPLWWGILVGVAVVWTLAVVLGLALVQRRWLLGAVIGVPVIATIVVNGVSVASVGAALLLLVALLLATQTQRSDVENRIKYRAREAFGGGLKYVLIGFLFVVAGFSLPFVESQLKEDGISVTEEQIALALRPIDPVLQQFAPDWHSDASLDDLIDQQINAQLPEGVKLSEAERQQLRNQIGSRLAQQQKPTGNESLAQILASQVNGVLANVVQQNSFLVTLVLIVLAFLTVRALVPLAALLLIPLLIAAVWLLARMGFVRFQQETVEATRLTL